MIWLFYIAIIGMIVWGTLSNKNKTVKQTGTIYTGNDLTLLRYVNEYRASYQIPLLNPTLELTEKAVKTVANFPPVSHNYFDGQANEIVNGNYVSLEGLFSAFVRSESHDLILRLPDAKYIGIGLKKVNDKYYSVILIK